MKYGVNKQIYMKMSLYQSKNLKKYNMYAEYVYTSIFIIKT